MTVDPFAGATAEVCDNFDNNCDGSIDENVTQGTTCGVGECAVNNGTIECIDGTETTLCTPGIPVSEELGDPTCADTLDNDCDGETDECDVFTCPDGDSDGHTDATCGGTDCDDTDALVYPGARRICDGKDSNCDGLRDFSTDVDNDGDGAPKCTPPGGVKDCDDNEANTYPGGLEGTVLGICLDGSNNDCINGTDLADPACQAP